MRAHIRKRYVSSYSISLNLGNDPATGKRKQVTVSVKGTKKEAEKRAAELIHQYDTGTLLNPEKTTLGAYLTRWLKEYAWANLSPRAAEGYETVVKMHLIPKLGAIYLTQLRPEHVQHYYHETLQSGRCNGKGALSARTVRQHAMVLHRALEVAVRWGLVQRNVADAVDPPRAQRTEMHFMDEDKLHLFLDTAKKTAYYTLFYLDLYTGMRRSEILALRWEDVDLLMCQLSVNRVLHQLHDGTIIYRQPKSVKSRRTIALTPSTAILLGKYRQDRTALLADFEKKLEDSDLVFCQLNGSPLLPSTISQAWRRIAIRAGLKGVRLHDARHTHASLMLKQGIHPKVVQERLGHASIQTTLDIYSHVTPGIQQAAANRFDEMVNLPVRQEGKAI